MSLGIWGLSFRRYKCSQIFISVSDGLAALLLFSNFRCFCDEVEGYGPFRGGGKAFSGRDNKLKADCDWSIGF